MSESFKSLLDIEVTDNDRRCSRSQFLAMSACWLVLTPTIAVVRGALTLAGAAFIQNQNPCYEISAIAFMFGAVGSVLVDGPLFAAALCCFALDKFNLPSTSSRFAAAVLSLIGAGALGGLAGYGVFNAAGIFSPIPDACMGAMAVAGAIGGTILALPVTCCIGLCSSDS